MFGPFTFKHSNNIWNSVPNCFDTIKIKINMTVSTKLKLTHFVIKIDFNRLIFPSHLF